MSTRINKYIAQSTGLSRRMVDKLVSQGKVTINGRLAQPGDSITSEDQVKLNNKPVSSSQIVTIMLNKPPGFVCSRSGQGSRTIYDLLPDDLHQLKPVGRLDKESSGLILLTNDGLLSYNLTHPKFAKIKIYNLKLDEPLTHEHATLIKQRGVNLDDGISKLGLTEIGIGGKQWRVTMSEGRNRQIRRTFSALGYKVTYLHRIQFGDYTLGKLSQGQYIVLPTA